MRVLILYTYNKSLLSDFFQELSEKLCVDGFEVDNFYLKHETAHYKQNNVNIYGKKRRSLISNYKAIYYIIKQCNPDVVISNFSYINPAILFGKLLGVKRNIAWFHTAFGHAKPNRLKVWNKSFYLNLADVVLTNSVQLQEEMHTVYKVPKQNTKRIPFWTNIAAHRSNSNSLKVFKQDNVINIGCPGRLLYNKNQATVIKALYQLKQNDQYKVRLYIAGTGAYQTKLEQLVSELNLSDDVFFIGLLNSAEMTLFYENMHVVVLPSFHEAFGLVFIESIALGTPVIVSNTFGALGFIDDKKFPLQDFSFDPYQIQELIYKLEPYLKHNGRPSHYFKTMYLETFQKDVIYNQIKSVILNETVS